MQRGILTLMKIWKQQLKEFFVAGDVRSKQLRQVVTATNDGAIAGQYIASLK